MYLLASGGRDGLVHLFDASMGYNLLQTLDGRQGAITAARFAHSGKILITCGVTKERVSLLPVYKATRWNAHFSDLVKIYKPLFLPGRHVLGS